ncbi:MAG: PEP-CTERM sorting domain-containing protein [Cognaticolwellia sp.]
MLKFINKIGLSISFLAFSALSNASLITNGSFEQLSFDDNSAAYGAVNHINLESYATTGSTWDVFSSLPGWVTSAGSGIELQQNVVTSSQDGSNHVELDSYFGIGASNTVMTQSIGSLSVGSDYLLQFYYKPRTNILNDNGINVFWYDSAIDFNQNMLASFSSESTSGLTPDWALQSVTFTAQAESMNLSFGSYGTQNTLGGLIDNVSLKQTTSVPEPSMLIMFIIGVGLIAARQRKWVQ